MNADEEVNNIEVPGPVESFVKSFTTLINHGYKVVKSFYCRFLFETKIPQRPQNYNPAIVVEEMELRLQ